MTAVTNVRQGPDIHVNKLTAPNFLHATDPLYVLLYTWIVQEFKKLNILQNYIGLLLQGSRILQRLSHVDRMYTNACKRSLRKPHFLPSLV